MSTRPIVPRGTGEGSLGTEHKPWGNTFTNKLTVDGKEMTSLGSSIASAENSADVLKLLGFDEKTPIVTEDKLDALKSDVKTQIASAAGGSSDIYSTVADGAGPHNSIYRGKNLTSYFDSGEMSKAIADGSFKDIFIGDYINKEIIEDNGSTKGSISWMVGECDYFPLYDGDKILPHHVILVPENSICIGEQVNSTSDISGGYVGTDMWKTIIPKYTKYIQKIFGNDHIVTHRERLTSSVTQKDGEVMIKSDFKDVIINIFDEKQVFGTRLFGIEAKDHYNHYENIKQLAIFALNSNVAMPPVVTYSLRTICSDREFCVVEGRYGTISPQLAPYCTGLRPYFLLK